MGKQTWFAILLIIMCGRYTLTTNIETLQRVFPTVEIPITLTARYNIAPTQQVAVIANNAPQQLQFFRWGLIPPWAKDKAIGNRMINARAETLAEKPSFRNAYKRRRCLVLADGMYEWSKTKNRGKKQPTYIHLKSRQPFAMAGLWETWQSPEGATILSCTIITTTPNELVAPLHHRMAVILPTTAYAQWLSADEQPPLLLDELLQPYPAEEMAAYPVSTMVNSPKQDTPACIEPLATLF